MLAESGLCLAFDDLPETSGQVTTAVLGPVTRAFAMRRAAAEPGASVTSSTTGDGMPPS